MSVSRVISAAILLQLLAVCAVPVRAQITITGHVQDDAGAAVGFANVQLLAAADSLLVGGTVADEAGDFVLDAVKPGRYLLYVSLIGYRDHLSEELVVTGEGTREVGPFTLVEQALEMEELAVEARRTLYEQKGDRLVINVGTSVTLSGATALDVLERSPGVIVNEQSGAISMLGKDGVQVMINGKLSYMPGEALVQFLSGMSADNIETIELITSPPAEFDAEGNAGFINIVLKRRPEAGVSGSLSASGGYGGGEVGSSSASIDYRRDRISLVGSYSFLWNGQRQEISNLRRIVEAKDVVEMPTMSRRDPVQRNLGARLGIDYQVSERTTIGAVVAGYDNRWSMNALNVLTIKSNGSPVTLIDSDNDEVNHWRHVMGNVNVRHRLSGGSTFSLDLDHLRYHNDNPTEYHNTTTDVASSQATETLLSSGKLTPLRILVAKADYQSGEQDKWKLGAGVKGALSRFTNEPTFVSSVQNEWVGDVGMGTKSYLKEDVLATYGSAAYQVSDAVSLEMGLRYELTASNLSSDEEDDLVDRRFGSLFPSLVYSHQLGEDLRVSASYNRRITRPSFNDMAPFLYFLDPYTFFTGSTALQPSIMNALKMDVTYKSVLASFQYAWEDSSIARFQNRIIPGENVQILFPTNLSDTRTVTALLAAPVVLADWWSTQNSVMTIWQQVDGPRNGTPVTLSRTSIVLNTTQNISLPFAFALEATGFYQNATLFGTVRFASMWGVNLGLQRALPRGKGKLTFSVDDLFGSVDWLFTTGSPADPLYIRSFVDMGHRTFRLTYSTRFGGGKEAREHATASEAERERVQ